MRTVLLTLGLVLLVSSVAMAWSHWWSENPAGYLEMWTARHEQDGRLMVQMRPILEGLGWNVSWDPDRGWVVGRQDSREIAMFTESRVAAVNGQVQELPAPARHAYGAVYVPLRSMAELAGGRVDYLGDSVRITAADGVMMIVHLL